MRDLSMFLAVSIAGGVGAVARYGVDTSLPIRFRRKFPWGTNLVNVTGSFALGLLTGLSAKSGTAQTLIGTGLLGGYTTFSSASLETLELLRKRRITPALANGLGMLVACVAAAALGLALA